MISDPLGKVKQRNSHEILLSGRTAILAKIKVRAKNIVRLDEYGHSSDIQVTFLVQRPILANLNTLLSCS